jgi:cytochrome o ubiquinol oxidase operon protein cyoD
MRQDPLMQHPPKLEYGNLKSYLIGLFLSLILTLAAYYIAVTNIFEGWFQDLSIAGLSMIQALIQLVLFVNLTKESKPRWNLMVFLFMLLVIVIVLVGSLWIINNLKYNLMVK